MVFGVFFHYFSASVMGGEKKYWFRAKRYGWGWGFPTCWQGWLVFLSFLGLVVVLPAWIDPSVNLVAFIVAMSALSVLLLVVCYLKGEPAKWRWGDSGDTEE